MNEPEVMWQPDPDWPDSTNIGRFQKVIAKKTGRSFSSYSELYAWSINQPAEFWAELWDYLGIVASTAWESPVTPARQMRETCFYQGARLNFAENLLRYRDKKTAVIYRDETGARLEMSGEELWREVASTAAGLRNSGVVAGDRVAGFVPNHPSALIAMLAATSIGAIWSSCSPDFGISGILDRFGQIKPKILFTAEGYYYNGKPFDSLTTVAEFAPQIPSIEQIVVFENRNDAVSLSNLPNAVLLSDFQVRTDELEFAQLPFDHPLFVLYTSGTTGVPKCIVHRAGGALIQLMKDHQLHCDLGRNDTLFFYSTCGWMMWNWLVTAFGIGARYIASIEKQGIEPGQKFDLSKLRILMSTGSVLPPESYDYVYSAINPDLQLASVTGGTDILSAFALGVPSLPLYRGEIQCRALGMATDVFNDDAESIVGESGELVCTRPFPSMPLKFWNDTDNERYDEAYFSRFDNVWCHGDFAELTERGGLIIHGRSDAVLNPGGVRIGTAEIYRQVEQLDEIIDSVCIGQVWGDDVRVVLFVVLRHGTTFTESLQQQIRLAIRENATPRHVPKKILEVPDIPRTLSGKIAEIAVRDSVNGKVVRNTDALANPQALENFRDRVELQT